MILLDRARTISLISFLFAGFASLFLWFWVHDYQSEVASFQKIEITAYYQHIQPQEIQTIIEQNLSGGFFSTDVNALKQNLMTLPWVSTVSIRKVWPATLDIEIEEQQAVALWNTSHVITDAGQLFTPSMHNTPSDLPILTGPDGQQQNMLQQYTELNRIISPIGLNVTRLDLSSSLSWSFVLSNGVAVELGRDNIVERCALLAKVYPKVLAAKANQIGRIDMRYPNGFAVQWRTVQS